MSAVFRLFAVVIPLALSSVSLAGSPFSAARGSNVIMEEAQEAVTLDDGTVEYRRVERKVAGDAYGNAAGNQYDLAVDGAFEGQTVAVLHFYTGEAFDFSLPRDALAQKGFSVYRWSNAAPPVEELREGLEKASQLWVISDQSRHLTDAHLAVIKDFWDEGHGVYIWGDNQPYYADANALADVLFDGNMSGNLQGAKSVSLSRGEKDPGFKAGHDITTGLEFLYEGVTIATIAENDALKPLIIGSAGNLVTATYDHGGRRAVIDGGFTRLYVNWDTAGTARYVKNAAAWLQNYERFGDEVVASATEATPAK